MDPGKLILRLLPILTSQMMALSVTTATNEGEERGHCASYSWLGFPALTVAPRHSVPTLQATLFLDPFT